MAVTNNRMFDLVIFDTDLQTNEISDTIRSERLIENNIIKHG
jgi:hypothetical protein